MKKNIHGGVFAMANAWFWGSGRQKKLHIHNIGITAGNNECGITYFSYKAC